MAKARTVVLKGKKLRKGKRKLGPEYLAVCTGNSGEDVEIKVSDYCNFGFELFIL